MRSGPSSGTAVSRPASTGVDSRGSTRPLHLACSRRLTRRKSIRASARCGSFLTDAAMSIFLEFATSHSSRLALHIDFRRGYVRRRLRPTRACDSVSSGPKTRTMPALKLLMCTGRSHGPRSASLGPQPATLRARCEFVSAASLATISAAASTALRGSTTWH